MKGFDPHCPYYGRVAAKRQFDPRPTARSGAYGPDPCSLLCPVPKADVLRASARLRWRCGTCDELRPAADGFHPAHGATALRLAPPSGCRPRGDPVVGGAEGFGAASKAEIRGQPAGMGASFLVLWSVCVLQL